MADDNQTSSSSAGDSDRADPLLNKNMNELIDELLEEKKALEEKNKKLAAMLDLCAKNANAKQEQPPSGPAETGDVREQVASLRKSISEFQKRFEKSITAQSSDTSKALMAEMKSRFSAVDEKVASLENLKNVEKKLDELQAEIHAKRSKGASLFGRLGAIAGGSIPEGDDEDEDLMKKLDELESKIERLSGRISGSQKNRSVTESDGSAQNAAGALQANFKKEIEKIAAIFSRNPNKSTEQQENMPQKNSAGLPDSVNTPLKTLEEKISEEAVERLILDDADASGAKLRIKFHEPSDFSDASKIQENIRAGDVILVNIRSLRQTNLELLKRIIAQLKKTCYAVNGNIVGVGDSYLIVMPKNVQLHKESETKL